MNKKYGIVIYVLIFTAVWSFFWNTRVPEERHKYARLLPLSIGRWRGEDVPLDKEVLDILETDDAVLRMYSDGKIYLYLWVVFADVNRKSIHPMEVCYRAVGWDIASKEQFPVETVYKGKKYTLPCIRLTANNGRRKAVVVYLYKSGGMFTGSYYIQQINVVLNKLLFRRSTSALIGVWVEGGDTGNNSADTVKAFIVKLFPYIMNRIP